MEELDGNLGTYTVVQRTSVTYDHRLKRTGHPVRSAIHKLEIGRSVVGWVTTSESLLLYVFVFLPTVKIQSSKRASPDQI